MKNRLFVLAVALVGMWVMTACSVEPGSDMPVNSPTGEVGPVVIVTEQVAEEEVIATSEPVLSFNADLFVEESAGIQLAYPREWTVGPREVIGERGAQAALLSPGSTLEQLADGGTRIILTTYQWDPKNDLDAFIAQRKLAWEASGFKVMGEEAFTLSDSRRVVLFNVETLDANQVLFAFLNAGEDYLQVSGDGDLELAQEIIRTIEVMD